MFEVHNGRGQKARQAEATANERGLCTRKQVMEQAEISSSALWLIQKRGFLSPAGKVGRHPLYSLDDVIAAKEKHSANPIKAKRKAPQPKTNGAYRTHATISMDKTLKDQLTKVAAQNQRSISREIEHRLVASFAQDDVLKAILDRLGFDEETLAA